MRLLMVDESSTASPIRSPGVEAGKDQAGGEGCRVLIQATALRHRVLAANLAHVESPGYQAQEATFAQALDEARDPGSQGTPVPHIRASVGSEPVSAFGEVLDSA